MQIRSMISADVERAAAIGAEVGWPGRELQFEFFARHRSCEALAAEVEGEVAGVGFGTRNGTVGWLGLICVSPRYQRRGIGSALTARLSERLEERGCRTLVLTATESGRPIYEKLGFSTETFYHGFAGPGLEAASTPPGLRRMKPEDLDAVCALDLRLTGEDRSHLLRAVNGPGWIVTGGPGEVRGYHLPVLWGGGPVIATDPDAVKTLLHLARTLVGPNGTTRFWLAAGNEEGRAHMKSIGFEEVRRLPRMERGERVAWRPETLYGLFSLGKG